MKFFPTPSGVGNEETVPLIYASITYFVNCTQFQGCNIIASFGFYLIYWFYRNWNHIKIHKNLSIRPWLRTLGLFVPVLNLFLLGKQFYYVKTLKEEAQIEKSFSPGWNLVFSFFLIFLSFLFENMLKSVLKSGNNEFLLFYFIILSYMFWFFSFYPFIVVQRILNLYWIKVQPEFIKRTSFSIGEIVLLIMGVPVVLIVVAYFIVVTFLLPKMPETVKSTNTEQSFIFKADIAPEVVYIPAGEFMMGSDNGERDEKPVHRVKLDAFYIGKYEVTQREWVAVMGNNPSYFKGDDLPVEQVSWNDVQVYLQKLSSLAGKHFRLPTEAEWEYACRAGSTTKYCFGDNVSQLDEYAWYEKISGDRTHPVGQKKLNAWGLYDIHGNVGEWCQDWYNENYYANSPLTNPTGPSTGQYRVLRGGNWYSVVFSVRLANRGYTDSDNGSYFSGFRCLQEP